MNIMSHTLVSQFRDSDDIWSRTIAIFILMFFFVVGDDNNDYRTYVSIYSLQWLKQLKKKRTKNILLQQRATLALN